MTRDRVQRIAGFSAAFAMLPYLIIKVIWTIDGLRGGGLSNGVWSELDWAVINALTVVMAGLAIALGLALAQPWGRRLPGALLLVPAWIGAGFLVPVLPLMPVLFLLTTGGTGTDAGADPAMPAREVALVSLSFAGFALGVAIALPLYVLRRWPHALTGHTAAGPVGRTAATATAAAAATIGLAQLFWAFGGTLGLHQADLGERDTQWHLLTGNNGLWALVAAYGIVAATHRGAGGRTLLLTWVASGFLFAWGTWKAAFTYATVAEFPSPDLPWMLALQNHFGALTGLAVLLIALQHTERARLPQPVS